MITIKATAEDGQTTKTYTITVNKEQSTNNYLESLETNIGSISPIFDKTSTGPYIINLDKNINSIILTGKKEDENANLICAKAADELLTISDITASFVIGKVKDTIYISGRSIGDINVQLILEKLRRRRT